MGEAKDVILMSKDNPVMRINFSTSVYDVINENLLPYGLKGKIRNIPSFDSVKSKYEDTQRQIAITKTKDALVSWFAHRTLLLSRANAKWIYNLLNISQVDSELQRLKISFICRSVSILDNYWVKLDGDKVCWDKIDITRNPLNEVIAQVALHGKSLTLQGSLVTPELTTDGAYAKAWRRHDDGKLWLHKLGHNGNFESKVEVAVSNILDKINVDHVHYEAGTDGDKYVCMCPAMSDKNNSILPAMEFFSYCSSHGLNGISEIIKIDSDSYYKMHIVDYLISNRDRHDRNWGLFYDPDTMEIKRLHPLFDHNNAFDIEWMKDKNATYQVTGLPMKRSAQEAMCKTDFKFTNTVVKDDFVTERQYDSFMNRAEDLRLL